MASSDKIQTWKEWCDTCKKSHIVTLQPCTTCGVHYTPQPKSDKVKEKHLFTIYKCDGCDAYEDHLR